MPEKDFFNLIIQYNLHNIIFATNNQNKVEEVRAVLGKLFNIITLKEAGIDIDIPEPHDTLEANATEKSKTIFAITAWRLKH
jgi:XTP/dITP diphosphohydrolase